MKNKMHHLLLVGLTLLKILTPVKSAKILGISPIASKSHHSFSLPIVKGLAARGHEVTVVSYFESNNKIPNYKEILLHGNYDEYQDWKDTIPIEDIDSFNGFSFYIGTLFIMEKAACEKVFASEYIRELIRTEGKPIDLIIAEANHMQCYQLLAHKLNTSLILVSPYSPVFEIEYIIGNPYNPAVTPIACNKFAYKMDFWQRLMNTLQYSILLFWHHNYKFNENMVQYAREVFNMELPSRKELNSRTALVFYNNHFSFVSRPTSPNLINIAGINIKEPKALPKDVEDFISGSAHGVILFSFGTSLKASSIPPDTLKMITDFFSTIPQRVLWRVNELNITKVPSNVKLGTWFPQRDILEHKNVIAFISHCGANGMFEAIHTGTPIIAVPLFGGQYQNANMLIEKKVAVYVDYSTMNENTLTAAIQEITTNSMYRENMQTLSRVFKDRPISPLGEALYWSEYVLKYQGASHLRTVGADIPLHQYLLLDVILFVLGIVSFFVYIFSCIFKIIISFACQQKRKIKTK